jgi:HSP20 family protein
MATDTGRTYGFDDVYVRGRDQGPIGGRKRKSYERDAYADEGWRGSDRSVGLGRDRGFVDPSFDRPFGSRYEGYWPYDYGSRFDYGYGPGTYTDAGYPYTFYSGGRYGLQQPPQAIGEAGFDLGLAKRRADERRYQNLRDWNRVEENPNIDDLTLWRPRADVFDQGSGGLRVEFELPGVLKEDISLTVRDDVITLAALKPQSRKEEAGFHYQNERHFGKFHRRLALPFSVDPNSVRAFLELGVLKVHLNRADGTERITISESSVPIGAPSSSTTSASSTAATSGTTAPTTSAARS